MMAQRLIVTPAFHRRITFMLQGNRYFQDLNMPRLFLDSYSLHPPLFTDGLHFILQNFGLFTWVVFEVVGLVTVGTYLVTSTTPR
jgi:hypothetical protein